MRCLLWAALAVVLLAGPAPAAEGGAGLGPDNVLVVYNRSLPDSGLVAKHYAERRGVPEANLVRLWVGEGETVSRRDYEERIAQPVAAAARRLLDAGRVPVALLVYGVPLRIAETARKPPGAPPEPAPEQEPEDALRAAARGETQRLTELVGRLVEQLLAATGEAAPDAAEQDLAARAERAVAQASRLLAGGERPPHLQLALPKIGALLFRLVGIAPTARGGLEKATAEAGGEAAEVRGDTLFQWATAVEFELAKIPFRGVTAASAADTASLLRVREGLLGELRFWQSLGAAREDGKTLASVDSELSLSLAGDYRREGWLPNPYLAEFDRRPGIGLVRAETLLVARLDAPTPALAKRLVDDALATEQEGLRGNVCIDARGMAASAEPGSYGAYDEHLRALQRLLAERGTLPLVFDNRPELLGEGQCPDAALYVGWYSLSRYVDAFTWRRGAVAFHVASGEAATLRNPSSQAWCKRMLEEGVAATLGPVSEPYLTAFPRPDAFFPLLLEGRMPLVQVYYRTLPHLSWQMVLVGDPLYTPFRQAPGLTPGGG